MHGIFHNLRCRFLGCAAVCFVGVACNLRAVSLLIQNQSSFDIDFALELPAGNRAQVFPGPAGTAGDYLLLSGYQYAIQNPPGNVTMNMQVTDASSGGRLIGNSFKVAGDIVLRCEDDGFGDIQWSIQVATNTPSQDSHAYGFNVSTFDLHTISTTTTLTSPTAWTAVFSTYADWEYFQTNGVYAFVQVNWLDTNGLPIAREGYDQLKFGFTDTMPFSLAKHNAAIAPKIFTSTNGGGEILTEKTFREGAGAIHQDLKNISDLLGNNRSGVASSTNAGYGFDTNQAAENVGRVLTGYTNGFGDIAGTVGGFLPGDGISDVTSFDDAYTGVPGDFLVMTFPKFGTSITGGADTYSIDLNIRHNFIYQAFAGLVRLLFVLVVSWRFLVMVYGETIDGIILSFCVPQTLGNTTVKADALVVGADSKAMAAAVNAAIIVSAIMAIPLVFAGASSIVGGFGSVAHTPLGLIVAHVASMPVELQKPVMWAMKCLTDFLPVVFVGTLVFEYMMWKVGKDFVIGTVCATIKSANF